MSVPTGVDARWKKQYISIGGYVNPTPQKSMPWLPGAVTMFLAGWYKDL